MLTNLLVAVSCLLGTNVSEQVTKWRSHEAVPCPENRPGCLVAHMRGIDPTEKIVTTTVTKITEFEFEFDGAKRKLSYKEVLGSKDEMLKLDWMPVIASSTNTYFISTNYSIWYYSTTGTNVTFK